jgi:hypothetical protein
VLNPQTDQCELFFEDPTGGGGGGGAIVSPTCTVGTYNPATDRCEQIVASEPECPQGSALNENTDKCEAQPTSRCLQGTTLVNGKCQAEP